MISQYKYPGQFSTSHLGRQSLRPSTRGVGNCSSKTDFESLEEISKGQNFSTSNLEVSQDDENLGYSRQDRICRLIDNEETSSLVGTRAVMAISRNIRPKMGLVVVSGKPAQVLKKRLLPLHGDCVPK